MDNALDGRLRRLEAGQVAQGEQLAQLVAGQERLHDAILRMTQLLTAPDPEGEAMSHVLERMTMAIERNTATLEALRRALPTGWR